MKSICKNEQKKFSKNMDIVIIFMCAILGVIFVISNIQTTMSLMSLIIVYPNIGSAFGIVITMGGYLSLIIIVASVVLLYRLKRSNTPKLIFVWLLVFWGIHLAYYIVSIIVTIGTSVPVIDMNVFVSTLMYLTLMLSFACALLIATIMVLLIVAMCKNWVVDDTRESQSKEVSALTSRMNKHKDEFED